MMNTSSNTDKRSVVVAYFQRKPMDFHYSIEKLFNTIRKGFTAGIDARVIVVPNFSKGLWGRVSNGLYARQHQGDVNHNTGDIYYVSIFLKKSKTVTTFHDFTFLNTSNPLKYFILKLFWVTLPTWRSAVVTTISETTKNELIKLTNCKASKVVVIPNIIDVEVTHKSFGFNGSCPNILQIGTTPNKNLERVIAAIADVACHFHIVGKLSTDIIALLELHKIRYSNYFQIPETELLALYDQADILTFCSLNEGFGLPILEAQSMGVPIVTSSISSMPEVAGEGALFVDPYQTAEIRSAILELISNTPLREKIVAKGYTNIKRFSPATVCEAYMMVYESLLKRTF